MSDYEKYRGKCKEFSERAVADDPTLTLVRGHYDCPFWGKQSHWWTTRPDGTVYDPTRKQFPTGGVDGEYVPIADVVFCCANCQKEVGGEADIKHAESNYVLCSYKCHGAFVGVF